MTTDELLYEIEIQYGQDDDEGAEILKRLASIVRAADKLVIDANLADHNGGEAGLRHSIENYLALRHQLREGCG